MISHCEEIFIALQYQTGLVPSLFCTCTQSVLYPVCRVGYKTALFLQCLVMQWMVLLSGDLHISVIRQSVHMTTEPTALMDVSSATYQKLMKVSHHQLFSKQFCLSFLLSISFWMCYLSTVGRKRHFLGWYQHDQTFHAFFLKISADRRAGALRDCWHWLIWTTFTIQHEYCNMNTAT